MAIDGQPKAVVFDAYGTLFDVHAPTARVAAALGGGDKADALGKLWREKQLQYSWLRGLMGAYADFWQVTQEALDYALEALNLEDAELRKALLALYFELDAYADARPALAPRRPEPLKRSKEACQVHLHSASSIPDVA